MAYQTISSNFLPGPRKNEDYKNYSIVDIRQNTEKSPGDLRRLSVTQIPVKSHLQTLLNMLNGT